MHALLLPVGLEWYALSMDWVREVVAAPRLVGLPTAPASVLGVFNLRGEIVPLFDTAALVGVGRSAEHPFAAVVDTGLGPAALASHATPEVVVLGEQAGPSELPGAVGAYVLDGRIAVLLDTEAVLAPARIGGARG